MPDQDTQVLISGGGLVGLSAAMFLAHHSIPTLVVEKLKGTSSLPRAAFFHMRTLELFRQAGIEDAVREQSEREFTPDGRVVAVESLAGRELAAFIPSLNEGVDALSPCRRLFVTQPGLEPILRRRAEEGGARVLAGHELIAATQANDGVIATVKNLETGEERQMTARYLVGAEGGRSNLRDQLGIAMNGRGVFSRSLTIYFRADLSRYLDGRNFSVIYVVNPVLSGFFRFDKDGKRGFLAVNIVGDPKADLAHATNAAADTSEPRLLELVRAAAGVPDLAVEIEGVARWRCTADIAQRFWDRRIFLAGDAVHLMPPTGGFGGNTGVQDAHNLAWKLALVLKGVAGPALLDTYESERRPTGHFTVEQAYTRYVTRSATYLDAKDYQPVAGDFDIELGAIYRSSAILTEPDTPNVHEDPHASHGRPGTRAPHLWLEKQGEPLSTLDVFGRGFVMLAAPNGTAWMDALHDETPNFPGLPIDAYRLDASAFRDPGRVFAAGYGIGPAGASLIRPDGYVAWRAPAEAGGHARTDLRNAFARILART